MLQGGGKINKSVVFREALSLGRFMSPGADIHADYELYAVLVHYGPTIFSGHYVAFVKIDEQWYCFDDATVSEVSSALVLKQNACICSNKEWFMWKICYFISGFLMKKCNFIHLLKSSLM